MDEDYSPLDDAGEEYCKRYDKFMGKLTEFETLAFNVDERRLDRLIVKASIDAVTFIARDESTIEMSCPHITAPQNT